MAEGKTGGLTLAAEDTEDLEIISARLQDAVAKVKDLVYLPKSQRFAALFNRFRWEENQDTRVRSGLTFAHVQSVKAQNLRREAPEAVVSLLAIRFTATGGPNGEEDPSGEVELVFAGGGAIRLKVEYIEAELTDISGEWAALGRPAHEG